MTLRAWLPALLSLPGVMIFTLFCLLPLVAVLAGAFEGGGSAFGRLFADPVFWNGLQGTLLLGTLAPLFSLVVGTAVAMALARFAPRMRMAALVAVSLPLTFSGLIIAYGFILLLGRSGVIPQLLAGLGLDPAVTGAFIYSPAGLGLAYSYYLVPRVVLIMLPAIRGFEANQIAAARSLGAGPLRAFAEVMLPQIVPSLIAAFALCAAVAIGAYGTALALVGTQINILPLVLYSRISEGTSDLPAAAAASLILVAICTAVVALAEVFRPAARS
ncbi:ABC transporter permease [Cereibacter changlensis JA139]|uniref:ABC transporter permease n=2 Tax=Cereibacter changlensis TaxID=402884 RepID=A0A2T4JPZ8_9RHOB|nr:ABC transporter permease subunit [Cereibacter changlensis]PTE19853.1 ABC transporter permease [Cereibacter changlensis JA139]PZX49990.1 putative spermidine/putrescine transport system permease protein [Cereibacter changlensis]